uniref:Uncharacterized protein n=1 Tax=Oryza sativa subsp. japonica TaxID=39947 RepID=Q8H5C4_ORYSJ|nr:hypothetical protein [Oryza sativa Japonica Group]BAD31473.1 hypothetical protein [Oryza sativa Japonica Group]
MATELTEGEHSRGLRCSVRDGRRRWADRKRAHHRLLLRREFVLNRKRLPHLFRCLAGNRAHSADGRCRHCAAAPASAGAPSRRPPLPCCPRAGVVFGSPRRRRRTPRPPPAPQRTPPLAPQHTPPAVAVSKQN